MRLALREMWRRPGQFLTATVILSLVAMLVVLLGSLLDGLIGGATGAIRAQDAEVIVYGGQSRATFARSRIEPDTRAQVADVAGVESVAGLGLVQLGARVVADAHLTPDADAADTQASTGSQDLVSVVLFGYEQAPIGVPEPPAPDTVYADESLASAGVEVGTTMLLGPARTPVTVAGFVPELGYAGQPALWAEPGTWRLVLGANRPEVGIGNDTVQVLVVRVVDGADPGSVARAIDAATAGATQSLTHGEAIEAIPGVSQQRATFNQIIGVTIMIAVVVVALFFALLTVERLGLYGVLKALGATGGALFVGLVVQAVVVTLVAMSLAGLSAIVLDAFVPPGSIPLEVSGSRILTSTVLLLAAAIGGCAFSLRRILRVDPATAIGA